MELLDYFDENLEPLGVTSREEVHSKGYWHKTFHCWLIRREGTKKIILFQKRSPFKKHFPNLYDITAAGHFAAGESAKDAARELSEELGVFDRFEDLIFAGILRDEMHIGEDINREFCYTYFLINTQTLESFHTQTEEVSGLMKLDIHLGRELILENKSEVEVACVSWNENKELMHQNIKLRKSELIPRPDSYYLDIFDQAEKLLD